MESYSQISDSQAVLSNRNAGGAINDNTLANLNQLAGNQDALFLPQKRPNTSALVALQAYSQQAINRSDGNQLWHPELQRYSSFAGTSSAHPPGHDAQARLEAAGLVVALQQQLSPSLGIPGPRHVYPMRIVGSPVSAPQNASTAEAEGSPDRLAQLHKTPPTSLQQQHPAGQATGNTTEGRTVIG
ncbi:hypothetical protein R1flu_006877 [Riccia fluitans]|uniref:Uncharacterized protein n=1 Tax=Riccia fluitans TaxID=41844 RepID=A0ABD1YXG8_9MARC